MAALTLLSFLPAILWGAILAIDLAPVHIRLTKLVGDRHRWPPSWPPPFWRCSSHNNATQDGIQRIAWR